MQTAFLRGFESLTARDEAPMTLGAAIAACLAFTYLNPHCWLDTVVLLGAIASPLPAPQRVWFGSGATSASFAWFFALGRHARRQRASSEDRHRRRLDELLTRTRAT